MRSQENLIFKKWVEHLPIEDKAYFIPDGVVNENGWNKAKCKILFLLKEVNGGSDWDEREYLAGYNTIEQYIETHSPTIDVIIKWIYGIKNFSKAEDWETVQKKTAEPKVQDELLSEIALVNLKKISGVNTVDWKKFDTYFAHEINRKFLLEQLELYHPDIVICGGTAYYLKVLNPECFSDKKWNISAHGVRYLKHKECLYIDYVHPNIRAPRNIIYYSLLDTVKELL